MDPDAAYLAKIGKVAYLVASLEWLVIGDAHRNARHLPADFTAANLAGQTTGGIAHRADQAAAQTTDERVKLWLSTGSRHLSAAAEIRNHVLHARPAHIDGQTRLHRWRMKAVGRGDVFTITDEWLDARIAELTQMRRELSRARPGHDGGQRHDRPSS